MILCRFLTNKKANEQNEKKKKKKKANNLKKNFCNSHFMDFAVNAYPSRKRSGAQINI